MSGKVNSGVESYSFNAFFVIFVPYLIELTFNYRGYKSPASKLITQLLLYDN
jgi:hypothetical protein